MSYPVNTFWLSENKCVCKTKASYLRTFKKKSTLLWKSCCLGRFHDLITTFAAYNVNSYQHLNTRAWDFTLTKSRTDEGTTWEHNADPGDIKKTPSLWLLLQLIQRKIRLKMIFVFHLDIKKVCDGSDCVVWYVDLQKGVELVVAAAQRGINSFIAVTPVQWVRVVQSIWSRRRPVLCNNKEQRQCRARIRTVSRNYPAICIYSEREIWLWNTGVGM